MLSIHQLRDAHDVFPATVGDEAIEGVTHHARETASPIDEWQQLLAVGDFDLAKTRVSATFRLPPRGMYLGLP